MNANLRFKEIQREVHRFCRFKLNVHRKFSACVGIDAQRETSAPLLPPSRNSKIHLSVVWRIILGDMKSYYSPTMRGSCRSHAYLIFINWFVQKSFGYRVVNVVSRRQSKVRGVKKDIPPLTARGRWCENKQSFDRAHGGRMVWCNTLTTD